MTSSITTLGPVYLNLQPEVNDSELDGKGFNGTTGSPYFHQTAQVVFLFILFLFIVIGNLAVLVAIGVSKSGRRSRMNFFIMNLAIADLSNAFFNVLTDTIWKITVHWYAGQVGCKIFRFLQGITQFAATYALVALSIDRLDAIARPLSFTGSGTRAKVLVGTAWALSFVFSIPMVVLNKYEVMPDEFRNCWIFMTESWHWQVYITLIAISLFIIPAIIIAACYGIIIFIVWVKSRDLLPKKKSKKSKTNGTILDDCDKDTSRSSDRSSSRGVIPQAKIRTIKMTLIIVIVFIVCWMPFFLFDLLDVYGRIPRSSTKAAAATFINSLAPLNSAANPIIYGIFSTRICRNLRRIAACDWLMQRFCCCCPCMKRPLGLFHGGTTHYSTTVVTDVSVSEDQERRRSGARLSLEPQNQRRVAPYDRDTGHTTKESKALLRSLPEEGSKCKEMESIA